MLKYSLLSVEASKYYENICRKKILTICKRKYFCKNVVNSVGDFIPLVYIVAFTLLSLLHFINMYMCMCIYMYIYICAVTTN